MFSMWHGYSSCEVNLTESTVVVLPAVELVLAGVGVDNGVVLVPVITLLDLILFIKIVIGPV